MNLVHDTFFRRTRSTLMSAMHDMDDLASRLRDRPLRVLFEASSPLSLAVFRPVFERLRQDPRLEFWFTSCDESWDAASIFAQAGITRRILTPAQVRWRKFDAYVNTDFWNMTWLPRRARRLHMFHGVAGKYGLDAPVAIAPVVAAFDRLLFPNADRLQRYVDAGLVDAESGQAALVGYPKVDCLVDGTLDRQSILESLGLDPRAPTLLYAPTWSAHSSLNMMGEEVISALSRPGMNVIVKLHDRSCDGTARGSGGIHWRPRLDQHCRALGVHLAEGADASPYLFVSDLTVTDHSSVGFEFMLMDRPIVVIDCPELVRNAAVNPQKVQLLRSASRVAQTAADVAAAVREELAEPHRLSARRRAIAGELFYRPGGATARAEHCLYDLLGMPAPVQSTTPSVQLRTLTSLARII
jgi:hypothetical protein